MFFFKSHAKKEARRLVPDLFLFFKKALYKVEAKQVVCSLVSVYFDSSQLSMQEKQTVYYKL